jgi:hypothetical protein
VRRKDYEPVQGEEPGRASHGRPTRRYPPGPMIPAETELGADMKISRTVVREAPAPPGVPWPTSCARSIGCR